MRRLKPVPTILIHDAGERMAYGRWLLMATVFLLLSNLLGIPTAHAATAAFEPIREAELAKALSKYQKIERLAVSFKQKKTLKDMDMVLDSEGELELKLPGQVIYKVIKPGRLVVTMTPEQIKFENGIGPSATIQTFKTSAMPGESEKRNMQAMVSWLKLDPRELARAYEISTDHENHFRFDPRAKTDSPFQQLELQLGPTGHVKNMTMNERSGDRIEFFFETPKITYAPARGAAKSSTQSESK